MKILAIETSCDETAIALLECSGGLPRPVFKVLANSLISQIEIHKEYGGVFPMLAKREHIKNLPVLLEDVLKQAEENSERPALDYIAVTAGPGLEPALWTGIEFAESLGKKWGLPVIPVNHMEGHLWSSLYQEASALDGQSPASEELRFPAIALLVSGGHTELVEVKSFEEYRIIGRTRDDAVGEAFDKVARLLGLPYPGGPKVSALALEYRQRGAENPFVFPRPMLKSDDYDFSYSGLKTAVLYALKKIDNPDAETVQAIAAAFEDAAIEPLVEKTKRALENIGAKSLIVGGGVSANRLLEQELGKLADTYEVNLRLPLPGLTTDNAIMIGVAAYVRLLTNRVPTGGSIIAKGNLDL